MNNSYPEDSNYSVPSKIRLRSINEENGKLSQEKVRKYLFSNKMLFQGKGRLKISSLTAKKKQTKSKRLLKENCSFTHLHHYWDSNKTARYAWREKIIIKGGRASPPYWTNDCVLSEEYQKTCNVTLSCPCDLLVRSVNVTLCLPGEDFLERLDAILNLKSIFKS